MHTIFRFSPIANGLPGFKIVMYKLILFKTVMYKLILQTKQTLQNTVHAIGHPHHFYTRTVHTMPLLYTAPMLIDLHLTFIRLQQYTTTILYAMYRSFALL